ncbi:glycosyltransferase family A protein [Candidatus Ponderosibacter sp. Uisw_141_02]|uniref:glycosyltransferase family A protein n=1 Tax=Candidatus Ponderosibacter sp. Uisw_141_02 TaxID=3231000 RepID=UPI003D5CDA3C
MTEKDPLYSICMINLNMAPTISKAIRSVAVQLDEHFEIVVVDGGSSDESIEEIITLQNEFPIIRLHKLPRDKRRRIGADRNTSVELARGKYVLLNIDCDDYYAKHLQDWIYCFHLIEKHVGKDVLVSGEHINMIKKSLFIELGGYKNIRFEDRDLWMRCASLDKWVRWQHRDFVTRMERTTKQRLFKVFIENAYGVLNDFQQGLTLRKFLMLQIRQLLQNTTTNAIIKTSYAIPAYIASRLLPRLNSDHDFDPISFSKYRFEGAKTLPQLVSVKKNVVVKKFINPESEHIFF